MARIRSIKPEFFTSEQVADCSPTARLLFIGMWCFCDDGGIHPASVKALKMQVFPGDQCSISDVAKWVDELLKQGLIGSYQINGKAFWYVTGWHHQRIEKPSFKYPCPSGAIPSSSAQVEAEFADYSANGSRTLADHSATESKGRESIGGESRGEEGCAGGAVHPSTPPARKPRTADKPNGTATWEAYSEAYQGRYGVEPVRNAKVNGQVSRFVQCLGADEAPHVARFFIGHQGDYYVRSGHPVGLMLHDAEKLRTEWATGRVIAPHARASPAAKEQAMEESHKRLKRHYGIGETFDGEVTDESGHEGQG